MDCEPAVSAPRSSAIDMTRGRPLTLMLRFALPLLVGNLFQQLYNLVDSLIVGNFVGTQALAAVSIGNYPNRVLLALFIGLGTGATIRISQHIGAGETEGVSRVIRTANGLIVLLAVPLTALGMLIASPVLRLMNAPADTFAGANAYLTILFTGALGLLGFNLNAGILRGMGDSRSPVLFLAIAAVINIALDLLFVAVLGMGVSGAAVATVIAIYASWIFSIFFINRKYPQYAFRLLPIRIDGKTLRETLRLGLPIGFNDALFSLGHLMLSSLINGFGSVFVAGYAIGGKVDALTFMPLASFAAAATTFTGQNVGAGHMDRLKSGTRTAILMAVAWSAFALVIALTCSRFLMGLFDSNPEVVDAGFAYIIRLEPFFWIYCIFFILNAVMNGAGAVRVPMIANLILFWAVRLPAAYLLAQYAEPNQIFFAYPISWLAGLLVSAPYYLSGRWKKKYIREGISS